MSKISPLAYIHPEAVIGENCEIGPFCYIDKGVVIGNDNTLMNSVTVLYGSRIGSGNVFFPGAVIGAVPQDLKFRGEDTTAEIGDNNKIRENVTINRGTAAKNRTVVGSNNLLMEGVHVAHDAIVGNGCILGNSTKLAGEIIIDDNADQKQQQCSCREIKTGMKTNFFQIIFRVHERLLFICYTLLYHNLPQKTSDRLTKIKKSSII